MRAAEHAVTHLSKPLSESVWCVNVCATPTLNAFPVVESYSVALTLESEAPHCTHPTLDPALKWWI